MILNIKTWHVHDLWISEALEARIYSFYFTKMLPKIQEKYGNILENIMVVNMYIKKNKENKQTNVYVPCFRVFRFFECIILYYILPRWGSINDTSSINIICKSLDMSFISIKTWNGFLVTFLFQVRESLILFYFQGRVPKLFISKKGNHPI